MSSFVAKTARRRPPFGRRSLPHSSALSRFVWLPGDAMPPKVDRPSARLSGEVENELFDLFVQLGADDDQMDYPTLYASGKLG